MMQSAAALKRAAVSLSSMAEAMGKTEQKRSAEPSDPLIEPVGERVDRAFDLWLRRGLHQLYDTVAKEPIPEALLRLINEDRASREK
ncbi:MAG: hypothetical protein QJR07_10825 [Acetobacteraceae bacterium]|nr:hypothetical protein [Acetobacteraceae bacterium]